MQSFPDRKIWHGIFLLIECGAGGEKVGLAEGHLLIPGTGGCRLLVNGADAARQVAFQVTRWIAGDDMFVRLSTHLGMSSAQVARLLSMRHAADSSRWPAVQTSLMPDTIVSAGSALPLAYRQFPDFGSFDYDWREDIRQTGLELLGYLRERAPSGRKWQIVAHSQGGLLAVVASKLASMDAGGDPGAFGKLVERLVLLAPPLFGTLKAVDVLVRGEELPAHAHTLRTAAATWPSVYQMLPVWRGALRFSPGPPGSTVPLSATFLDYEVWESYSISRPLLDRARATRTEFLDSPLSCMKGVEVRIMLGRSHQTCNHVLVRDGHLEFVKKCEPGDGVVPSDTTYNQLGVVERSLTHLVGNGKQTLPHAISADDPVFAGYIHAFVGS